MNQNPAPMQKDEPKGIFIALGAYLIWGVVPIFWKELTDIPPLELLPHRILWAFLLLCLINTFTKRNDKVLKALRNPKALKVLAGTTVLIACNWFIFMWAILNDKVLETSLGYYINPLTSVILGMIFLGERMRRLQMVSVLIAAVGVAYLAFQGESFPLAAIGLTVTFGFYSLLRKVADVDGVSALTLETGFLSIPGVMFMFYMESSGQGNFLASNDYIRLMMFLTGAVTAAPLLLFGIGVRMVTLRTIGFLQYTSPTISFFLGVFLFNEAFGTPQQVAFGCIWAAVTLYTLEGIIRGRKDKTPKS